MSNFSSFPQYFQYTHVSLTSRVQLHIYIFVKWGCSNYFQFCKSDMSRYGYLDVFHRVPWISRQWESTVYVFVEKVMQWGKLLGQMQKKKKKKIIRLWKIGQAHKIISQGLNPCYGGSESQIWGPGQVVHRKWRWMPELMKKKNDNF